MPNSPLFQPHFWRRACNEITWRSHGIIVQAQLQALIYHVEVEKDNTLGPDSDLIGRQKSWSIA